MSLSSTIWFCLTFLLSVLFTVCVRSWARRRGIVDAPDAAQNRKIHTTPTPLLGGLAIYGAFALPWIVFLVLHAWVRVDPVGLFGGYLLPKHILGILIGGLVLMIGGWVDDNKPQPPGRQLLWPILAALAVVASGIGIEYITNPFGEAFQLDQWSFTLFSIGDTPYRVIVLADLFTVVWLMGAMYTTKFLDGLDGLVSGVSAIGMLILFFLSLSDSVGQPETAFLALMISAAFLGFLVFNWHPASIFLGEGGSLLAGFLLGTFAVLSGGKIATALLILGIPILDVVWVILRRLFVERGNVMHADRKHLHFRLLDIGLSHRQAVSILYVVTAVFGSATLFVEGKNKLLILLLLGIVMVLLAGFVLLRARRLHNASVQQS